MQRSRDKQARRRDASEESHIESQSWKVGRRKGSMWLAAVPKLPFSSELLAFPFLRLCRSCPRRSLRRSVANEQRRRAFRTLMISGQSGTKW
eukprot:3627488-Rhodomonas_salina.3